MIVKIPTVGLHQIKSMILAMVIIIMGPRNIIRIVILRPPSKTGCWMSVMLLHACPSKKHATPPKFKIKIDACIRKRYYFHRLPRPCWLSQPRLSFITNQSYVLQKYEVKRILSTQLRALWNYVCVISQQLYKRHGDKYDVRLNVRRQGLQSHDW